MVNLNICVMGESGSGKTQLLNVLDGNGYSGDSAKENYWARQYKGTNISKTENGDTFDFHEIMGSRGRSSNRTALHAAFKEADVVLFCLRMDSDDTWHFRSISYAVEALSAANKKCKLVIVGTMHDEATATFIKTLEADPISKNFPFLATSALREQGLEELLVVLKDEYLNGAPAYEYSKAAKEAQEAAKLAKEAKEAEVKEAEAKSKMDAKDTVAMGVKQQLVSEELNVAPVA